MRTKFLPVAVLIAVAGWFFPEPTHAQLDAGVVLWRYTTNLDATRATDFDGSDDTFNVRPKEWDTQGSGVGLRVAYQFPRLASVYGQLGMAQVTVRDEDITDPNLDLNSRGFDEGLSARLGARLGEDLPGNENIFWALGLSFSLFSSEMNEDINTTWDYDATSVMLDGTAGYRIRGVGVYGGLRFVRLDAQLDETDTSNPPGMQFRTIELERESPIDLVLGARTGTMPVTGFVELGVVGSFSATTGLSFTF